MDEFQVGKDMQQLLSRLSRIEGALLGYQQKQRRKPCNCKSAQPLRVGKGTESAVGQKEIHLDYKSGHWNRFDAGDCEITFIDYFIYSNGDWRVNFRAHDNGTAFGDSFTLKISIRNGAVQEIEKLFIMNSEGLGAGGTDDLPRNGHSEQLRRQFQDIEIGQSSACVGCNKDCDP